MAKLPGLGVNLYRVIFGVAFSLVWANVMYMIWPQPSFLTFVWFYLTLGSLLLKWVFFEIIDRIYLKCQLRAIKKELEESDTRVRQAGIDQSDRVVQYQSINTVPTMPLGMKIKELEDSVSSLTDMVATSIECSLEALKNRDMKLARQVIQDDRCVDYKEFAILEDCMRVIASGYREADKLREIVAILGIITELERIGDYAEGIANIALMIGSEASIEVPAQLAQMGVIGLEMLRGSVQSFLEKDIRKAKHICKADDEVDTLYEHTLRESLLSVVQQPKIVTQATRFIWAAHNLERFADRVTNICEWVVFSETGQRVDIDASKY